VRFAALGEIPSHRCVTTEHVGAISLAMHEGSGFSCAVTGSDGLEQEILRLRNANRDSPETLEYIDWRYQSSRDAPEPRVFWLLSQDGQQRIGMASVVFRPYWINGVRVQTAVVGDISLDTRWRGRGLGRLLLRFMTNYLDEHFPQQPAFVIPTEAARKALASVGWVTQGALVPHVYVLDCTRYVRALVRSGWLATRIAGQIRRLAGAVARARTPRDGSLHFKDTLDESLLQFARTLPASDGTVHDTGPEALRWRYAQHPKTRFTFATFSRSGEVRGFLVFEESTLEQTCSIYDLVARTRPDMRAMLALFILRGLSMPGLITVRVLLDDRHPHRTCLRRLGFIARRSDAVFQVHSPSGTAERLAWCVTQGDKDT
jgi:RimJ/RimL family protein N-acetyltransferase